MKLSKPLPIKTLAIKIGAELYGNDHLLATGINEIHKVQEGDITFVDAKKYFDKSLNSPASIIILNEKVPFPEGKAILVVHNPFEVYNQLVWEYRPFQPLTGFIHQDSDIHPSAIIEPGVIIAPNVVIGENCHIQAGVVIQSHVYIGKDVTIQSGSIIGTDAFYYKKYPEGYTKWRSGGRVIIEDEVEIGAACTINKGVSGDTIIGKGTKLDCQIHIGHGAVIGKNCLFAAQVGIGGKTIIGDHVTIYGQVGVAQAITIGNNTVILAKSGISKSLDGGKTYFGIPAEEFREKYRELAALRSLPDLLTKLNKKE
jgi:UDP-3-O-[3-hydroxymyristoyl] glucosamine N-acyltransferase